VYADNATKQGPQGHAAADSDDDDDSAHRIWTMRDLRVLHELQKPVTVVVSGVYEDPHRFQATTPGAVNSTLAVNNAECVVLGWPLQC